MIDFSIFHLGNWRAGEIPLQHDDLTHILSYDQRSYAYAIKNDEEEYFVNWAATCWEEENDPRHEGEGAKAYLGRICVDFIRA